MGGANHLRNRTWSSRIRGNPRCPRAKPPESVDILLVGLGDSPHRCESHDARNVHLVRSREVLSVADWPDLAALSAWSINVSIMVERSHSLPCAETPTWLRTGTKSNEGVDKDLFVFLGAPCNSSPSLCNFNTKSYSCAKWAGPWLVALLDAPNRLLTQNPQTIFRLTNGESSLALLQHEVRSRTCCWLRAGCVSRSQNWRTTQKQWRDCSCFCLLFLLFSLFLDLKVQHPKIGRSGNWPKSSHRPAPFQHALSTRAGCECIGHALQFLTERDPSATITSIDGISAFDTIS